ncbi:MAG: NADH-quinone oxidoreductase subunit J [Cyclobacteriaceae bacterium]|jgi:NADH:ubiquinone oxidoreductase subunit 6 (subunit J)|nr:NADH-quinone oxidoreductase subunit J [Cyclobacteriaceae bacterium]
MDNLVNIDLNVVAFYMLAGMSVCSALMIVFSKNVVQSIFLLVVVFVGIAGIYMISNAEFVGVTQILVYVGGILILLMFGIMLTNRMEGQELTTGHKRLVPAVIVGVALMFILTSTVLKYSNSFQLSGQVKDFHSGMTNTQSIGINLMTDQVLALEITAILLLVALVGAAYLVGNKNESIE